MLRWVIEPHLRFRMLHQVSLPLGLSPPLLVILLSVLNPRSRIILLWIYSRSHCYVPFFLRRSALNFLDVRIVNELIGGKRRLINDLDEPSRNILGCHLLDLLHRFFEVPELLAQWVHILQTFILSQEMRVWNGV